MPPTDAELAAKNVPPLRNGYDPSCCGPATAVAAGTDGARLSALESSYSGWIGGIAFARYRSGTPGFDRLTDLEAPFEASAVLGKTLRATVVPRPVFLNSGTVDTASFQNSTGIIPVLGTLSGAAADDTAATVRQRHRRRVSTDHSEYGRCGRIHALGVSGNERYSPRTVASLWRPLYVFRRTAIR